MKIISLVVATAISMFAMIASANSPLTAEQLRAKIQYEEKYLAEMKTAIRQARYNGTVAAVKLTKHAVKYVLIGYGTTKFYEAANMQGSDLLDKSWNYLTNNNPGKDPFTKGANQLAKMDPKGGVVLGPLPRAVARDGGIVAVKVVGLGTLVTGVVWSAVEAVYSAADSVVLFVDASEIVVIESLIQIAQERLTSALADLDAVQH